MAVLQGIYQQQIWPGGPHELLSCCHKNMVRRQSYNVTAAFKLWGNLNVKYIPFFRPTVNQTKSRRKFRWDRFSNIIYPFPKTHKLLTCQHFNVVFNNLTLIGLKRHKCYFLLLEGEETAASMHCRFELWLFSFSLTI